MLQFTLLPRLAAVLALAAMVGCNATGRSSSLKTVEVSPMGPSAPTVKINADLLPARSARVCLRAGEVMEEKGLPAEAIAQYEKARQFDPKLPGVSRRLAVLYDRQGDYVRASAEYKLALESGPNHPELLNDMGYYCYERGEWKEAERWLRKAVAVDPKSRRAWVNLGMTLAQSGQAEASLEAFSHALTPAESRMNLGLLQAQNCRRSEASATLRKSIELEPDAALTRAVLEVVEKPGPATPAPKALVK